MSPLDLIPTEYRLFAKLGGLLALVAGLMLGYYWLTSYHERIGYQHAVDVMTRQALAAEQAARGRPWLQIARQPVFIVAVMAAPEMEAGLVKFSGNSQVKVSVPRSPCVIFRRFMVIVSPKIARRCRLSSLALAGHRAAGLGYRRRRAASCYYHYTPNW